MVDVPKTPDITVVDELEVCKARINTQENVIAWQKQKIKALEERLALQERKIKRRHVWNCLLYVVLAILAGFIV